MITDDKDTKQRTELALATLKNKFPLKARDDHDTAKLRLCAKYLQHAEKLRRKVSESDQTVEILESLSWYYYHQQQSKEKIDVEEQLWDLLNRTRGERDPRTVAAMANLA